MGRQSLQHGASLPNIPEFSAASMVAFFLLTVSRYIYIYQWVVFIRRNWFESVAAPLDAVRVRLNVSINAEDTGFN